MKEALNIARFPADHPECSMANVYGRQFLADVPGGVRNMLGYFDAC